MRKRKKHLKQLGKCVDELTFVGDQQLDRVSLGCITYNENGFFEQKIIDVNNLPLVTDSDHCYWIDVQGLHDVEAVKKIGSHFKIHNLTLEDILDTQQRPKFEEIGDNLFFSIKHLTYQYGVISTTQYSFVLGKNYLISFQELDSKIFEALVFRMRNGTSLVLKKKSDFLLYTLLDIIVDDCVRIVDTQYDKISILKRKVLSGDEHVLYAIEENKNEIYSIQRILMPVIDVLNSLKNKGGFFIDRVNESYFIDVKDNVASILSELDDFEKKSEGLSNIYFSMLNKNTNDIIKFLTIISTIFIPLSFIASVYGMNFKTMPELDWKYGYFSVLGLMLCMAVGLLVFLKKRKWL
ncbi:MAG: magnesium/cobalt transporter CorA [Deltaproteobacteria bacterium]|jgi:magnesium transporter|nr:magnesium/cobalt transporter CorA [Deltaproteobacteria bacterium]